MVCSVLGLLALLAVGFVVMVQMERKGSLMRLYATRALLLARSGVEDARARLQAGQAVPAYGGENWDGDAAGLLSPLEASQQTFHVTGAGSVADTAACPVAHSMRPSFFVKGPGGAPALEAVDTRQRGYSGRLTAGSYALKMAPAERLSVNAGDPASGPLVGYNAVWRRVLGTFAEAVDREDGVDDGMPVDEADGWALISARPPSGWRSLEQIRTLALGGSAAKLAALEGDLTLEVFADLKVIRPNPPAVLPLAGYKSWASIRGAHLSYPGVTVPDFERMPVAPGGRVVGRCPVDLAWARTRRPVLQALLAGLEGVYLDESTAEPKVGADRIGHLRKVAVGNAWTAGDDCDVAVQALLTSTSILDTWQAWDAFCDTLAFSGTSDQPRARRDILKAQFNPNSVLNKLNPDATLARLVDKSDLSVYSTELSLPSRGGGRVRSAGRVLDARGRCLALKEVAAELAPDQRFRLSTQREFVAAGLGRLELAGDETSPRTYGDTPFITPSQGTGHTFGAVYGAKGVSLQTLPEPHTAPPADCDGRIQLATVESYAEPGMLFRASWDDAWDADVPSAATAVSMDVALQPASTSVWAPGNPGTFLPDGAYVELDRTPGYPLAGNVAPTRGTASFWVKPNYDVTKCFPGLSPFHRRHIYLNATRHTGIPSVTQCFTILNTLHSEPLNGHPYGFTLYWENVRASYPPPPPPSGNDFGWEQNAGTPNRKDFILPHRWYLLTMMWDFEEPTGKQGSLVYVDAGLGGSSPTNIDRNDTTFYNITIATAAATPLTDPDGSAPAYVYLGRRGPGMGIVATLDNASYGAPDATLDELLVYDFGTPASTAEGPTSVLASQRFTEGRYYKESVYGGLGAAGNRAGEWFSAPVDLGNVVLTGLAWTQTVPRGLRAPAGAKPEDGDPGLDARILLELSDIPGTGIKADVSGIPLPYAGCAAGSRLDRRVAGPFRLHAVFQPMLADPNARGIIDPLALDDVTLLYRPLGSDPVTHWEEGA